MVWRRGISPLYLASTRLYGDQKNVSQILEQSIGVKVRKNSSGLGIGQLISAIKFVVRIRC